MWTKLQQAAPALAVLLALTSVGAVFNATVQRRAAEESASLAQKQSERAQQAEMRLDNLLISTSSTQARTEAALRKADRADRRRRELARKLATLSKERTQADTSEVDANPVDINNSPGSNVPPSTLPTPSPAPVAELASEIAQPEPEPEPAPVQPAIPEPPKRVIRGTVTVGDINGALIPSVGGYAGQPLGQLNGRQLDRLGVMLDKLGRGTTYPCPSGAGGGFSDIARGANAVVRDGMGTVLGTTSLEGGVVGLRGCAFRFTFRVADADFYDVEVTDRGALTFSRSDLVKAGWKVDMKVG